MGMGFKFPWSNKKQKNTLFFGLYISDLSIHGFIYSVKNSHTEILKSFGMPLSSGLDQLVEDVDKLLEKLEEGLTEPLSETIYFLHSYMIEQDTYEIKTTYKEVLKQLSKSLQLKPMGYVDVQEGLALYLENNSLPNIITLEINKTKSAISVFKGGKKIFSKYFSRTDEYVVDLQSVLLEVPRQVILPSKILIFGTSDSEMSNIKDLIDGFQFEDQIFEHHPKTDILRIKELERILITLLGNEIPANEDHVNNSQDNDVYDKSNRVKNHVEPYLNQEKAENEQETEIMGFVINQDVKKLTNFEFSADDKIEASKSSSGMAFLKIVKDKLINLRSIISGFNNNSESGAKRPIILGVIFAVTIFVLGLIYEYFFHTIQVKLMLKTEEYSREFEITVPVSKEAENFGVAVEYIESQEFSEEKNTTGKRETGEKATGEVILYNYGKDPITLKEGSELKTENLVFLTNTEIKVSGRTEAGERGTAKGAVTASKIGPEYNVPKNTPFSTTSYSDDVLEIIADKPFTGGNKKEVPTVSRADIEALQKKLDTKIKQSSKDVLGTSISETELLVEDSVENKNAKKTYSSEIGEEAQKVKATIKSETSFITLNKEMFLNEIASKIQSDLEVGKTFNKSDTSFNIKKSERKSDEIDLSVEALTNIYRKISNEELVNDIVFKSPNNLSDNLKNKYAISAVEIVPSFSHGLWTPLFPKNINITFE